RSKKRKSWDSKSPRTPNEQYNDDHQNRRSSEKDARSKRDSYNNYRKTHENPRNHHSISISTRQVAPSPNPTNTELSIYSNPTRIPSDDDASWHFMTTNVFSEGPPSDVGIPIVDLEDNRKVRIREPSTQERLAGRDIGSSDNETNGQTSMYTALDYQDVDSNGGGSSSSLTQRIASQSQRNQTIQFVSEYDIETGDPNNTIIRVGTEQSITNEEIQNQRNQRRSQSRTKKRRALRRNSLAEDEEEVEEEDEIEERYYGNSSGSHRHSLDYITALHSVQYGDEGDELFQKSLDMMVGMSFGSVSLMKKSAKLLLG
ncbi:MAG: hypothetical protein AAF599_07445, partial [Bacteroidota bacterium]